MPTHRALRARLARTASFLLLAAALAGLAAAPAAARSQKLRPCEYQGVERIVAVGDIHGAYDRFLEILRVAGVTDERNRWAGEHTHLVQIGDMVDRGPDSRKVIDFLRDLVDQARRAGGAVHVLLGNHEVMRMLGDLRYTTPGEYEAFVTPDSVNLRQRYVETLRGDRSKVLAETPLGLVEMRIAFGRNGEYGQWLRSLDTVIRINDVVFVHGGLSPEVATNACNVINDTVRRELTTDLDRTRAAPLKSLAASPTGPFWYRGLSQESDDSFEPKVDEILSDQHAKAIVVGHTVQKSGRIEPRFGGRVFALDTGMQPAYAKGGRASALEIKDGVFTAIYTDRRDVLLDRANGGGKQQKKPTR
jgi:hypothetical protein